jgi:acetylglutamate kinase
MDNMIVIKCGGSTIDQLSDGFFRSIKALKDMGASPVIVHGGGPAIKDMLTKLNVQSEFVNGLRKTDEQVMDVVEMVLSGKVNKMLVRKAGQVGLDAIGLSGCDSRLIEAVPRDQERLGFVGEVSGVNTGLLLDLMNRDIVPVIAPVGLGKNGHCYNINADTAAGAIAMKLGAKKLLFVTDVPGILKDGKLLKIVTEQEVRELIKNGTIYGGMIPKVEAALKSLQDHLEEVMIVDGKESEVVRNGEIVGTTIKKGLEVVI